jgi:hypothetical protein
MSVMNSKSILAKLLAAENITVQHKNVSTAYFMLQERALVCPLWKEMSVDLYDLLMGHEVGHALFTPAEGWHDALEKNGKGFKSYLNIIEDARIERKMKNQFPGLRKPFYAGYRDLFDRGFFGVTENFDLRDLPLIDRINLHFKIGMLLNVPFSSKEQEFVDAVEKAETWNEVRQLAEQIYTYAKEEEAELPLQSMIGDLRRMKDADGDDLDDFEYLDDGELDDTEDSDEADDFEKQMTQENGDDPFSITDQFFRENEKQLKSEESQETLYLNLPRLNMKGRIIGHKTVHANMFFKNVPDTEKNRIGNELLKKFKTKNEKYIAYLIKEFTLRKNARVLARAAVSKTGELDMKKLHTYRLVDDIFKRVTIVPQGQNHGMVMFIDCSASMTRNMQSTIEQTLILTSFCRKVNIPFRVFGFKNGLDKAKELINATEPLETPEPNDWIMQPSGFRLREYISSSMSSHEYINAQKNLLCLGQAFTLSTLYGFRASSYKDYLPIPESEILHSTPLNEAVIASIDIVNSFKQRNKLDIVNTIFLTDGESDSRRSFKTVSGYQNFNSHAVNLVFTDKRTKLQGTAKSGQPPTVALLDLMKKLTGTRLIGFYLMQTYNKRHIKNQCNSYAANRIIDVREIINATTNKFFELKNCGYDSYYLLPGGSSLGKEEETLQITSNDSKTAIKSAFRKNLQKKSINRMFLNRFMEHVS